MAKESIFSKDELARIKSVVLKPAWSKKDVTKILEAYSMGLSGKQIYGLNLVNKTYGQIEYLIEHSGKRRQTATSIIKSMEE